MSNSDETTPLLIAAGAQNQAVSKSPANSINREEDVPKGSETLDDYDKPKIPGVRLGIIVPAMGIGVFLAAIDNTVVVSSYGAIGTEMEELDRTSWIATSYLLTQTSFQPLYGKVSDIFGRKPTLLFSYLIFGIGCLGCGLARTMNELIAARAFAGIGGGGMTTVASILLSDIVSLRSRGTFQGVMNIIFAIGASIGAPVGGIIADSIGWRWSFLAQIPFTCAAIFIVFVSLHLPTTSSYTTFRAQIARVDFLGAGILVCAVLTLLIGLDRGGNVMLNDPIVIGTLSFSTVAFILLIYVEGYIAAEPFAPSHIVKMRSIFSSCAAQFFSLGGYMLTLFYITLYYQAVSNLSAAESGLRIVPAIVGGVFGSLFGGIMMQKTGKYYHLTIAAYIILACAFIPLLLLTGFLGTSTTAIGIGLFTMGFANGISITSTLIAVISAAGSENQAVATAMTYLFRSLGTVIALGVGSMLVQGSLRRELGLKLNGSDADEIVRKVRQSLKYINELPEGTREIVVKSYEHAVHAAFILGFCLAICSIVSSFFIKNKNLG